MIKFPMIAGYNFKFKVFYKSQFYKYFKIELCATRQTVLLKAISRKFTLLRGVNHKISLEFCLQNSAVYILYRVIKGMNKVFIFTSYLQQLTVPFYGKHFVKGHFTKVYPNKGGQPQNFSGILSAVYILYVVIKGTNKVFFYNFKKFLEIYKKFL